MFNFFIEKYKNIETTVNINRSYSNGDIYRQNGFELNSVTKTNHKYVIGDKRYGRIKFKKINRKIYKIYDSGNLKFIYKNKL